MNTLELIPSDAVSAAPAGLQVLTLANDADPATLALDGITRIELNFPKFTDGRAFSQAYLLRRRLDFRGDIRATGDVLVDQLLQMQRSGFSSAVLRADQNLVHAQRQLTHFAGFYQGDAAQPQPQFTSIGAAA
ncbi:MAG: DUF934 domain-containing protein [Polaromonas sp.]|nr:DUF934 domain-containing protein [Polaromonas sp.]